MVGRRVELGGVVALTGRPLDRARAHPRGLVRARLVTEEERGREVTYEIAHPLVQRGHLRGPGGGPPPRPAPPGRPLPPGRRAPGGGRPPLRPLGRGRATPRPSGPLRAVRQAEERGLYREGLTILGSLVDLLPPGTSAGSRSSTPWSWRPSGWSTIGPTSTPPWPFRPCGPSTRSSSASPTPPGGPRSSSAWPASSPGVRAS